MVIQGSIRQAAAWLAGFVASIALHATCFSLISSTTARPTFTKRDPIRVKVVEKKLEPQIKESVQPEPEPPPPPPPPPKPKPKPKPPKNESAASNKPVQPIPEKPFEAIQGFNKDTLNPASGPGIAVPIGNTVMTKDTGKRVEEAPPITGDLSQDARIIPNSYIEPSYTDAAIDANLEGRFIVDVFVDEKGNVVQAELRKKVGYGMDQKIITAAKSARFVPRKNRLGIVESGWTNITITLKLP